MWKGRLDLLLLALVANIFTVVSGIPFTLESNSEISFDDQVEVHVTKRNAPHSSSPPGPRESNNILDADALIDSYEYDVTLRVMEALEELKLKLRSPGN
jgi:hypothetical protein